MGLCGLGARALRGSLVLGLAALLAGCGAGTRPSAADQSFLAQVSAAAPDISGYKSATDLVRLGVAVCDDFRSGATYQQIADRLGEMEGPHPMPSEDLGAIIDAAVSALCPQFGSRV